jgi:hypothetical protein
VCAPVHDAILVEAPLGEIEEHVAELQACMREASRIVLGGLELGSDAKVVRWPDRYADKRGEGHHHPFAGRPGARQRRPVRGVATLPRPYLTFARFVTRTRCGESNTKRKHIQRA